MAWVRARLCILQKGCTRLAVASDKVYQLLAHGRWFSPSTPASSTTKTGPHDIADILLNVVFKHQNQSILKKPDGIKEGPNQNIVLHGNHSTHYNTELIMEIIALITTLNS